MNYHSLFNNAPIGITVTDKAGHLLLANNAIREMTGYSEQELTDLTIRVLYLAPEERARLIELTNRYGKVRDFETMFKHKIGTTIAVLLNTDLITFNGQSDILLTSIRDISHLKQAEHALAIERDFSNTLLDIAAILIVVLDHDGSIQQFNRACEQLSGYTFGEIRGKFLWDTGFSIKASRKSESKPFSATIKWACTKRRFTKSGEIRLVSWTFSTVLDRASNHLHIIATGIDITQQRQATEQLRLANEELAARVKELQTRSNEMNLVNQMGEQLQSCMNLTEACDISAQYIKKSARSARARSI
ncbi:MAG: PAS domain-containing protein [Eubacteriales bacterium]